MSGHSTEFLTDYLNMELSNKLRMRMIRDFEQYKIDLLSLDPVPYKEEFNPTCLFSLDMLANIIATTSHKTEDKVIYLKFYSRNNFYLCILTSIMDRIVIFTYKLDNSYRQDGHMREELIHRMALECINVDSKEVVFHRIHDVSEDVKVAVKNHWVSKSGFFLND